MTQLSVPMPFLSREAETTSPTIQGGREAGSERGQESSENNGFETILAELLHTTAEIVNPVSLVPLAPPANPTGEESATRSQDEAPPIATPVSQVNIEITPNRQELLVNGALQAPRALAQDGPQGLLRFSSVGIVQVSEQTDIPDAGALSQVQNRRSDTVETHTERKPSETLLAHTVRRSVSGQNDLQGKLLPDNVEIRTVDQLRGYFAGTPLLQENELQPTNPFALSPDSPRIGSFGQVSPGEIPGSLISAPGGRESIREAIPGPLKNSPDALKLQHQLRNYTSQLDEDSRVLAESLTGNGNIQVEAQGKGSAITSQHDNESEDVSATGNHRHSAHERTRVDLKVPETRLEVSENQPKLPKVEKPAQTHSVGHDLQDAFGNLGAGKASLTLRPHSPDESSSLLVAERTRAIIEQITQELTLRIRENISEVRIRLKPEVLGEILVTVQQEETTVAAQIHVEHAGVKTAIDTQLPQLRQALVDQGIDVRRLEVIMADQSMAREFRGQQLAKPKRRAGTNLSAIEEMNSPIGPRSLGYNTIELIL